MRLLLVSLPGRLDDREPRFGGEGGVPRREADRFRAGLEAFSSAVRWLRSPAPDAAALLPAAAVAPLLRDRDYGDWTGQRVSDIAAAAPKDLAHVLDDAEAAPPRGESVQHLVGRSASFLASLEYEPGPVAALTHPAVTRGCLAAVVGAPTAFFAFNIAYGTHSILTRNGGRWRVGLVNAPLHGGEPRPP